MGAVEKVLEEGEEYTGIVSGREEGKVPGKGGFVWIRVKGYLSDLFAHDSATKDGYVPKPGDKVRFIFSTSSKGPRAVGVEKI